MGIIATLFINGHLKSFFNPTERPRGSFFQDFYGTGDPFDVNTGGNPGAADSTVFCGAAGADVDNDGYNALTEYAAGTNDADASSHPEFETSRDGNGIFRLSLVRPEAADDVILEALDEFRSEHVVSGHARWREHSFRGLDSEYVALESNPHASLLQSSLPSRIKSYSRST